MASEISMLAYINKKRAALTRSLNVFLFETLFLYEEITSNEILIKRIKRLKTSDLDDDTT